MSRAALELLALLAQDAPVARIDALAAAAADEPGGAEAGELARRVRAGIDTHRRREAELSALVDTARDLASRPEPGGVLDAIVRRARSLLGTDTAYLTLYDPAQGDTYMRATAGSVSARFQALRLPLGAGLGGLVAQSHSPHWTSDYPTDTGYAHTREIDTAVGEEGLVAICGTPLLVDGQFVGVLFAADRDSRPFDVNEVALLGSLAALAAVSLVAARRAAETATALAALSEAHAGIQQAAAAHDRFTGVVLSGGDVADVAAALGELLACWVVVLDADDQRVAAHGPVPPTGPSGDRLAEHPAVTRSAGSGRLAGEDGVWAVVVRAAGQRLGVLVLGGPAALDGGQGRTVERAATVTALVLLFRLRAAEADRRLRSDLLTELLDRPAGGLDSAMVDRGRLLGLRLGAPHVLLVCRGPVRGLTMALAAAGRHRHGEHGDGTGAALTLERDGETVAVVAGTDPSAVAVAVTAALDQTTSAAAGTATVRAEAAAARDGGVAGAGAKGGSALGVTVGAAGPVAPAAGLREARAEAQRVTTALTALRRRAGSVRDLGFAGLVAGSADDVTVYLERVLGPVEDYDRRRGTDLLGTLDAYFAAGASPRRAAAALHVHVNTVGQRLDRVAALLGADWTEPDRALELQLALRLRRLRGPG